MIEIHFHIPFIYIYIFLFPPILCFELITLLSKIEGCIAFLILFIMFATTPYAQIVFINIYKAAPFFMNMQHISFERMER